MGPVGVGLPRCDRVWAAVESFFDPIQLCKRSFPVSVLHEFWVTGQYNSDTSNFQLFIAIFTRVGMEPYRLHAHDGEFLVDFIMLEDPCGG